MEHLSERPKSLTLWGKTKIPVPPFRCSREKVYKEIMPKEERVSTMLFGYKEIKRKIFGTLERYPTNPTTGTEKIPVPVEKHLPDYTGTVAKLTRAQADEFRGVKKQQHML